MRRTTICRSSRVVWAVVVALPLAATLAAQQDTTTAHPAAPQDTTAHPAASQDTGLAVPGGKHTVVAGETLWSISQQNFSDALLWPEIYRRNTSVIEDPHWIYPGEVLDLGGIASAPVTDTTQTVAQREAGADTTGAADTTQLAAPPPPPTEPEGPGTIFDRRANARQRVEDVLRAYAHQVYRPVRRGEFYSAGFLTEGEKLPWATVVGNTAKPSIPVLANPPASNVATQFEEIAILPPSQASYHIGDSLLVARLDRDLNPWGSVVVPVGVARVTSLQERQVLATVIMQFGRIRGGTVALPLEPFKDPGEVRPADIDQGLQGHLIDMRDSHVLATVQQVVFLDKGRADGVALGDVFEAYRPASGEVGARSEEVRVQLLVAHTREHTSSAIVIGMSNPQLIPGMPVRLIKKMPS
ncbi:MAG TPA: LysM peptidoglycan-binding domain-containing protein [Gemmatimonadales bacterium]|nr:LysM peptidoglycan-binding domain-containing protein [Gemmatimonadales bacterium]